MSKVKIQGAASGSAVYTLTTGAGSTDRTITLPDGTGTLLTTDGDGSSLTGIQSPLVEGTDYLAPDGDGSSLTGIQSPLVEGTDYLAPDGDGSSLTGTGSPSIDDNGNATAITIDASEQVGIGTTSPDSSVEIYKAGTAELMIGSDNGGTAQISLYESNSTTKEATIKYDGLANNLIIGTSGEANAIVIPRDSGSVGIGTSSPDVSTYFGKVLHLAASSNVGIMFNKTSATAAKWSVGCNSGGSLVSAKEGVAQLEITSDGRGLSQFTAKAWCSFQGNSTVTIKDSHNVSSVTDNGSGDYSINFSNNMANTNYSFLATSGNGQSTETDGHTGISLYDEASAFAVGSVRFRALRWKFNVQDMMDPKRVCAVVFGD